MINNEIFLVLSAALLNFLFTSFWFLVVKRCHEKSSDEDKRNPTPFLISFIGSLWSSYGLFLMIKHIRPNSISELLGIAMGAWICILMALSAKHYSFAKMSLTCFFKDYLVDLFGLIIMSYILWNI